MLRTRGPFAGRCRGGPWDGKDMEQLHYEYRVARLPPISLRPAFEPPDKIVEAKWGTYHHVAGQWIWREDG